MCATKNSLFGFGILFGWIVAQLIGVSIIILGHWRASQTLPWVVFFTVLFGPVYVCLVHGADSKWKLGGLRSIKAWLDARRNPATVPRTASDPRTRSNLALQPVTITTGFAALLAFQTARFYKDLTNSEATSPFLNALLMVIATLFVVACISNLLQVLLHQFLAQSIWNEDQQGCFRSKIRFLQALSWHFLMTPVILILCLLPYPWHWLCYAVNFLYGLSLYWYYFSVGVPAGFFAQPDKTVRNGA
jgi:hypothetical protein